MSDYMPIELITGILERLPVKSLLKFRSVCKTWNNLISHTTFISAHLHASLSRPHNNNPFLLLGFSKKDKPEYFLHYDNDGFDKFKQLQLPPICSMYHSRVIGSCNGLICAKFYRFGFEDYDLKFVIWNPLIQKYISLPQIIVSEALCLNSGFGFDLRTNDYKLLIIGIDKDGNFIRPYLFSVNENCWKRVTAVNSSYHLCNSVSLPFVNGALHWFEKHKRNNGRHSHVICGFNFSSEEFFEMNLPESSIESSIWLCYFDLSIMKYKESSISVTTHPITDEFDELWVMKEYGVVESWTKVLTINKLQRYAWFPRVLGFRKNGEVLFQVTSIDMASLDLNSQQMEASFSLKNCQPIELPVVDVGRSIIFVHSYVESLVLLDKEVDVYSESDVYHPIGSSDSDQPSGGRM